MTLRVKGHEIGTRQSASKSSAGRWFAECSCGYRSSSRTSEDIAAGAALHHVTKVIAEYRRNGITPPVVNVA
jgi:hypothetical protein